MPRAFPIPVNIGTDICKISRIQDILTKHQSKYAHRFIQRVFTPQEQVWYRPRLLPLIEYLYFMERRELIQGKIEKQERWRAKSLEALIGLVRPEETPPSDYSTAANSEPVGSLTWASYPESENSKKLTKEEEELVLTQLKENVQGVARFVAGRFAAKEAAKKAFSKRRLNFHDITIDNPSLDNLRSRAPITLIRATTGYEDQIVPMSISHDGDYATAVCMSCEDVAPPPEPDLQEIEPMLGRLLDEMTIKRLSLSSQSMAPGYAYKRIPLKDFTPKQSPESPLTPLEKIPVKLTTPITGRLSEIISSTLGGGSKVTKEDLNVSEVPSTPTDYPVIHNNLDGSEVTNLQAEASLPSPDKPSIRYHMSTASAFNSINVDLLNKSFNRNSPGFQPRDYTFKGTQATGYQSTNDQMTSNQATGPQLNYSLSRKSSTVDNQPASDFPTSDFSTIDSNSNSHPRTSEELAQSSNNDPVFQRESHTLRSTQEVGHGSIEDPHKVRRVTAQDYEWICPSTTCGAQNRIEDRKCRSCGTKRLEGWANYIDRDCKYNKRLAEVSNHTSLDLDIDPAKEEEKKIRIANRLAKLQTRTQSIYGLPPYLDAKIIRKNIDNCLRVEGLPVGATNEELMEALAGRCTAAKGYVKVGMTGKVEGWVVLSRTNEANKLRHQSKRPELLPVIRGRRLKFVATDEWARGLLREYGSGARIWDWRADFWITDVFHRYDKEECAEHAQQQEKMQQDARDKEQRIRESKEEKNIKRLKKVTENLAKKGTKRLEKLERWLKEELELTARERRKRIDREKEQKLKNAL